MMPAIEVTSGDDAVTWLNLRFGSLPVFSSATYHPSDLEKLTKFLCASVSLSVSHGL